ncbi:hypothetical protein FHS61_002027 [Altererythrobacter atlanticus]|uniref:Uncharacterized protein n=1 Tax=Croceibacterium atlanticum TaxID=1267766 RepID=A0A0F7KPR0_9SPHN|nr:hypothetical protein [Croceibacterium atlanticum]AKH41539.1 hypothetical protein WYH_00480 [Croceibacterium atlanticum]MBB5733001.1 hypothetical protein [Croceibacterium atlanticum]
MVRKLSPARRKARQGLSSALALALALTGGAVLGTVALDTPAQAQDQEKPKNSKAFAKAYQPVADMVNAEDGDTAAAKEQLPEVIAKIENSTDRFFAGNLSLMLGNKLNDKALQRQGLELMVESGQTPPEQLGQFQFFIGNLAYDAKDYAAAREALLGAKQAGYQDDNLDGLLAETYFVQNMPAEGVAFVQEAAKERMAAGQPVPAQWLLRALQIAYNESLTQQANDVALLLVQTNPTKDNWVGAMQVIAALNEMEVPQQLDFFRLMMATDSLSQRREFVQYIEAADPRIMSTEVQRVLDAAVGAGELAASDQYYADVKRVVDQREGEDAADAPSLEEEARSAASGEAGVVAGDVYMSLANYAKAEEMYQLAVDKGGADANLALTRLGIAQTHQGKFAEAKATFAKVDGNRALLAKLWSAYADSQA